MIWHWTPSVIPLVVAGLVPLAAIPFVWRRLYVPGAKTAVVLLLATAEWILSMTLELAGADLPTKLFWNKAQYLGVVVVPSGWLVYVLQYTGREKWLTRRNLAGLSVVPVVTLLLAFTNYAHHLLWSRVELTASSQLLDKTYSAGLPLVIGYSYLCVALGIFVLFRTLVRSGRIFRWQTRALLWAVLTPWLADAVATVFDWQPIPDLELTPLALAVTLPVMAWGLNRMRRMDIMPVARETVIEGMVDAVLVLDAHGRVLDMNPAAERLVGRPRLEAVGHPVDRIWPEWQAGLLERDGAGSGREVTLNHSGEPRTYDARLSSQFDWRGQPISYAIVLRDMTERKRAEEQVKASLQEKEVLLKEIHHRVKNNMQVVSSLISLQARLVQDPRLLDVLLDSQNRVRSMALIHEKLYQSRNLARVNFADYIHSLASYLFRSYGGRAEPIGLQVEVGEAYLDIDMAVPLGLILNELLSNALKHAFPDGRVGHVCIALGMSHHQHWTLTVGDYGAGFPEALDFRHTDSLGMQLVMTLVSQLGGAIDLERGGGTRFCITFSGSPYPNGGRSHDG